MSNLNEAMFQLTNVNDKVKLDLKKVGLIIGELQRKTIDGGTLNPNPSERSYPSMQGSDGQSEIAKLINQLQLGFAQIHTKAIKNEKQYSLLEQLTKESLGSIQKLRQQVRQTMNPTSNDEIVRLQEEIAHLKQQSDY